jgi:hypothetical protein
MSAFQASQSASMAAGPTFQPEPTGLSYTPSGANMDEKSEQLLVWPLRATMAAKTALRMSAAASGTRSETSVRTSFAISSTASTRERAASVSFQPNLEMR